MKKIFTRGYNALVVTQFLGACNDNILKQIICLQVVDGIWRAKMGSGGQGTITLIFALPFLLCSGWAGQLADRYSKQKLSQWAKIAEVVLALTVIAALWLESLSGAIFLLLFLAVQSTAFGPAKYGMIPELLPDECLSRANGVISMMTNLAIITGVIVGGFLSENYPAHRAIPGFVMLGVAVAGYVASLFLQNLPARDPSAKVTLNPMRPYIDTLKMMARRRYLLDIALGLGFFGYIGVMVLQAILDFKVLLQLSDREASYLNVPIMVGVAVGSMAAGYLSRSKVRVGLVPIGAFGMAVVLAILGMKELTSVRVVVGLISLGFFGGVYVVPLMALLQGRSPLAVRGRVQGARALLDFALIALGGVTYKILRGTLDLDVQTVLVICSIITLVVAGYLFWSLRRYLMQRIEQILDA